MDNAWKTLKQIILILLVFYFLALIFETGFLPNLTETKSRFDFSRYLYKILNLE